MISSFLSDLISGLIGAAIITLLVRAYRKIGPERERWLLSKLRPLRWPLLTVLLFAIALASAVLRGAAGIQVAVLGVLGALALALFLLIRFGPERFRRFDNAVRRYGWQILAGVFFLSTFTLFLAQREQAAPQRRITFVVDLADEAPVLEPLRVAEAVILCERPAALGMPAETTTPPTTLHVHRPPLAGSLLGR